MSETFETPQDAEDTFYDAFEEGNLDKMMTAWAASEEIVCIQPLREQVQGQGAVRRSWQELFASGANVEIEIHHKQWIETCEFAIHIVHEQLVFNADRAHLPAPLIATNVYRKIGPGWRLILHHVSPPPPPMPPNSQGMGPGIGPPARF
jgi:ketosteroid isomerase-like protein